MAFQTIKGGLFLPPFPGGISQSNGNIINGQNTMDSASEGAAVIFRAPAAKNIHKIWFRTSTVTTGGANNIDLRVETVDGSGKPSGSLWATNTNCSFDLVDADDNLWKVGTLTADATLAIGDEVALVIRNPATSFGSWQLANVFTEMSNHPYASLDTAGSSAWAAASVFYLIFAEYSDGSFEALNGITYPGIWTTTGYNSGSGTNVRGNLFQVPFPCRVTGAWVGVTPSTGAADFSVKLYDAAGSSVLATTGTIDGAHGGNTGIKCFPFTSSVDLSKNTNYRIVLVPETATTISGYHMQVGSASMLDMLPLGQLCFLTTRSSGGSWTDSATDSRALIGVMASAFDDAVPASSGGGSFTFA